MKLLQKLYIENEELYTNPEQRRAQHILLEEVSNASAILKEIKQGGDFSELARIHSKDITTSEEGGDLGYGLKESYMVPVFDEAVFDMNIGDISDVVKLRIMVTTSLSLTKYNHLLCRLSKR